MGMLQRAGGAMQEYGESRATQAAGGTSSVVVTAGANLNGVIVHTGVCVDGGAIAIGASEYSILTSMAGAALVLPKAVRVPAGQQVKLYSGTGQSSHMTYEVL